MPYTVTTDDETTWVLHILHETHDETGTPYAIYFFTREGETPDRGTPADDLPDDYHVTVSDTGMPVAEKNGGD